MTSATPSGGDAACDADLPGSGDSRLEARIKLAQLDTLYEQLPRGLVANIINGGLLAWILSGDVGTSVTTAWFGCMVLVNGVRWTILRRYRKMAPEAVDYALWRNLFAAGTIATAL